VCTELLQDLLARGFTLDGRVLCVIDGGKGLRKALGDVFGDAAVIQRCQVHKGRNLDASCRRRATPTSGPLCAGRIGRPVRGRRAGNRRPWRRGWSETATPMPPAVCAKAWRKRSPC
jgi:hypothetical protein